MVTNPAYFSGVLIMPTAWRNRNFKSDERFNNETEDGSGYSPEDQELYDEQYRIYICPKCQGNGYIEKPTRKRVVKPEKDPWDTYEGHKVKQVLCTKCQGRGVIIR